MFIPFIFSLDPANDYYYLWIFYKFLNMAKQYNAPFIAQEQYFVNPEVFKKMGKREVTEEWARGMEYDLPCVDDLYKIKQYPIPKILEKKLIEERGSQTNAWTYVLSERWKPLEEFISTVLEDIINNEHVQIEGFFTWCHIPSLSYIAQQYNIPVIHMEWGPLRPPSYRKTAYFDFTGVYKSNQLEEGYIKFINQSAENQVHYLSRKEILSIFLDYKLIENIDLLDCKPEYEIGVACTYTIDLFSMAYSSSLNNLEVITIANRYYSDKNILVRPHPGDPARANTNHHILDNSPSSMHFVNRCKRIAVINSNIAFEAMLWGRTAYVLGASPYLFKAQGDLSDRDDSVVELEFVNYVVFAYLVPYELMLDVEYIRWRLSSPTEVEIYNRHLNYYLACRGIDTEILTESGIERLRKLLLIQGFNLSGKCIENSGNEGSKVDVMKNHLNSSMQLNRKIQYLMNKVTVLNMQHSKLELAYQNLEGEHSKLYDSHQNLDREHTKLNDSYQNLVGELNMLKLQNETLVNSTCWKITSPIRYVLDQFKNK